MMGTTAARRRPRNGKWMRRKWARKRARRRRWTRKGKTEASEGKAEEREGVGEVVERGSGIGRGVGPVVRGDGAAEFDCVEEGYGEKAAEAEVDCSGCELLDGDESDAGAEE